MNINFTFKLFNIINTELILVQFYFSIHLLHCNNFISRYGICFVSGLYCFAVAVILFLMFINDTYMVSLGVTYHEWQEQYKEFKGDRPCLLSWNIIRNALHNWRAFFNNV